MDLNQKLTGIIKTKVANIKVVGHPERQFTLNFDFSNCTIADVVERALAPAVINFANKNRARGEEHMAGLSLIQDLQFMPLGTRGAIDIEASYMSRAEKMDADQLAEQIAKLQAKLDAKK